MDVILLERVEKLGQIGDVVTVKNGFARNFLLPNKKALRANAANKKVFEANRARIESDNASKRGEAEAASSRDIVEALAADDAKVTKSQVVMKTPIKAIGVHEVRIALHPEVSVTIKVNVARSPEEAELQAQGIDVMASMFEKDEAGFTEAYDPNAEPGEIPTDIGDEAPAAEATDEA